MDEELLFLRNFWYSRLPDLVGNFDSSMGDWINKTTVHVKFNHLVRRSELRILGHCHVEWQVLSEQSGHERHGSFSCDLCVVLDELLLNVVGEEAID